MKIKKILISQPKPESPKSPYDDLISRYKIKIDFYPFIKIESISTKEFNKQRVNFHKHTAVILTSRNAADHFFRMAREQRFQIPDNFKYFCLSEAIAYYLQKYITFRKRKVFFVQNNAIEELSKLLLKYKEDKYILPCSDIHKADIPQLLKKLKIKFNKAILYRTVSNDLSKIKIEKYDMLVFFSPSGIRSLLINYPDFKQNGKYIATFGKSTKEEAKRNGLYVDIPAPTPDAPSMKMAIENFIKKQNKSKRKK